MTDDLIRRTFPAELTGDGRTVDCRIVPYGERIVHNDGLGGLPVGQPYTEEWVAGAFKHQLQAANRVHANVEHEQGIRGVVGHGITLREEADGLYGSFTIHEEGGGPTALRLIREGSLDGVSLEAKPVKKDPTADGVVRWTKANLLAVAFCRFPAYENAKILALREQAIFEEKFPPMEEMDTETVELLRRIGAPLPPRYQAHPEESDTPAETGTSASAPAVTSTSGNPNVEVKHVWHTE